MQKRYPEFTDRSSTWRQSPLILGALTFFLAASCPPPESIKNIVECRNSLAAGGPVAVSDVLSRYAPDASVACTSSRASAQPASPEEGDLRCFQVFTGGLTVSFNLVEGLNGDRLEISQPADSGDRDRVFLANVSTLNQTDLTRALAQANEPVEPGSAMTCGMCHQTIGQGRVDGIDAWIFAGIRLNSTLRGTIPRNGQVPPDTLMSRLRELQLRHGCQGDADESETCRRMAAVISSPRLFPLDSPVIREYWNK